MVQSSARTPKHAPVDPKQAIDAQPEASPADLNDAAIRRHCATPVPFGLQTNRPQGMDEGQGKAHLAPGMHFKDLHTPGLDVNACLFCAATLPRVRLQQMRDSGWECCDNFLQVQQKDCFSHSLH